jgi:hypothetical protein
MYPIARALVFALSITALIAAVAYAWQPRHVVIITRAP